MSDSLLEGPTFRSADDEITWAGECPWTGKYCFGTESGEVLFFKDRGDGPFIDYETLAEETINGVAFYNDLIGVSTRSNVSLHRLRPGKGGFELIANWPGGAHGILATENGLFVAPMGPAGLFCIDARSKSSPIAWFDRAGEAILNYYALSNLGRSGRRDVFVCAARTDGLVTIQMEADAPPSPTVRLTSPNVDIIDVCSIGSPDWPFAVAALCLDRSLIFVRNALSEEHPKTVRFEEFQGTPYSILSTGGHLFVLTSREIVVLPDLAARYLSEQKLDRPTRYRRRPVQAVDAFIAYGKDLMILTDEGVSVFAISKLVHEGDEPKGVKESPEFDSWDRVVDNPAPVATPWVHLVA
jgi:hypothetical protein